MNKLEVKKKEKKDALLNAAFDLFISKGPNKTSISDISKEAGVAKGTFYLYFKDKYSLQNHLIGRKADILFFNAWEALNEAGIKDFTDQMIFLVNHIIDQLSNNHSLLLFISKHLSWGVFKNALIGSGESSDKSVYEMYEKLLADSGYRFDRPDIMVYLIIEMVGGASYNAILYEQPASLTVLKPYLFQSIRSIVKAHILTDSVSN